MMTNKKMNKILREIVRPFEQLAGYGRKKPDKKPDKEIIAPRIMSRFISSSNLPPRRFGRLVTQYKYDLPHINFNIGDSFQSFAVENLLAEIGVPASEILPVNRDTINQYTGESVIVPMQGWFDGHSPVNIPLIWSSRIVPVFLGYHLHEHSQYVFQNCGASGLMRRFAKPIGCRDRQTAIFLASQGIFSYFSGCMTLTLPKREKEPSNGKVFIVDIPPSLLNKIPESIRHEAEFVEHNVSFSKVPIPDIEYWEFENYARKMLHRYKTEARLIITSRIHCAMPCAAMGIPTIFLTTTLDDCRFDVLSGILPIHTERSTIDWDVPASNLDEVKHFIKSNALHQLRQTAEEYGIALGAPLQYDLLSVKNRTDTELIRTVSKKGYTYLGAEALYGLADEIRYVDEHHIEGILIETGVAGGGSSIVAAKHKDVARTLKLYDSYEGMPEPSEKDGDDVHSRYKVIVSGQSTGLAGNIYYGYEKDLLATVKERFSEFGIMPDEERIEFVKGYYEKTLAGQVNEPVAFAHIDCDWYESVKTTLENIVPHLSLDGRLIIDDYEAYSGCRKAVDEFFADKKDEFEFAFRNDRLHIVKIDKMGGGGGGVLKMTAIRGRRRRITSPFRTNSVTSKCWRC